MRADNSGCNFLKYVTLFSCDTFGFYVSWVYLQYGVQVVVRQFNSGTDSAFVTIILALLMLVTSFLFQFLSKTAYFHRIVRRFFADYGMPIALIATSGMAYWGRFNSTDTSTPSMSGAFHAANERAWLVKFWELDGKWVGIALPFGIVLWILFFFDHNVSVRSLDPAFPPWIIKSPSQSLMAQGSQFPLRKPPGFHYDFFLLGITTLIAGLIGVPAPNGLIPQAPIHTASLVVMGHPSKGSDRERQAQSHEPCTSVNSSHSEEKQCKYNDRNSREVPIAVVEQRVSNLAQGTLCLVLFSGPFVHLPHHIPRGVLAGLL